MTPPLDPDFISPGGVPLTPHPRPGPEQEAAFTRLTGLAPADLAERKAQPEQAVADEPLLATMHETAELKRLRRELAAALSTVTVLMAQRTDLRQTVAVLTAQLAERKPATDLVDVARTILFAGQGRA